MEVFQHLSISCGWRVMARNVVIAIVVSAGLKGLHVFLLVQNLSQIPKLQFSLAQNNNINYVLCLLVFGSFCRVFNCCRTFYSFAIFLHTAQAHALRDERRTAFTYLSLLQQIIVKFGLRLSTSQVLNDLDCCQSRLRFDAPLCYCDYTAKDFRIFYLHLAALLIVLLTVRTS